MSRHSIADISTRQLLIAPEGIEMTNGLNVLRI